MNKISISTKLSLQDTININYYFYYSRWYVKVFTGVGLLLMINYFFPQFESERQEENLIFGLIVTILIPISIYFSSRMKFKTNARIQEEIIYEFDEEHINVIGNSFSSSQSWEKIYKVSESKNWILIWNDRQSANPIPKRDISEEELMTLKGIVIRHPGLKNKMK